MVAGVGDLRSRPWASWRNVSGRVGTKRTLTRFVSYAGIVLVSLLEGSFFSFRMHVGLHVCDNIQAFAVEAGAASGVVLASASSIANQPRDKKDGNPQRGQQERSEQDPENQNQHTAQEEQLQQKSPRPGSPLRLDSSGALQDSLRHSSSNTVHGRPPGISTVSSLRDHVTSPSGPLDDRSHGNSDAGGRHHSHHHRGDTRRPMGCDSHSRVNPFPLFSRMSSIGDESTCLTPIENEPYDYETDDEFRAASIDESAASGLCANSLQSLSLSTSAGGCCSAGALPSPSSEMSRPRLRRRFGSGASANTSRRAPKAHHPVKRRRIEVAFRAFEPLKTLEPANIEEADFAAGEDEVDGRTLSFQDSVPDSSKPSTEEVLKEALSYDDVDAALSPGVEADEEMDGDYTSVDTEVDAEEEAARTALSMYQETRALFKKKTEKYEQAINAYYGRNVVPFEPDPSGCAKTNIDSLVAHVVTDTSLLSSTSLRELMHLAVRVLWRGMQLVFVCYPSYSYLLGRNGDTVAVLPHFITIFEKSLKKIAQDPGTSAKLRQEQLDAACKAQSAASQGEAALGAMQSVVLSGLTTPPSKFVDVIKVQDLLGDIDRLPASTRRLLLMLAELCRAAYEMSEPQAQPHLCQEQPTGRADRELEPVVEESIAYCRGETTKFARVFNEAQVTAKEIAEQALTLYKKLTLLELVPDSRMDT